MIRLYGIVVLFVWSVSMDVGAKPLVKGNEIPRLEKKIAKTQQEVAELRASLSSVRELQAQTARDLALKEAEFRADFSKVISPLLNWPEMSMNARVKTWVERDHGRFLLETLRERLVREPLELIAERELSLRRAEALQQEIQESVASLEAKQQFLSLQVEELKYLQKRPRPKGK